MIDERCAFAHDREHFAAPNDPDALWERVRSGELIFRRATPLPLVLLDPDLPLALSNHQAFNRARSRVLLQDENDQRLQFQEVLRTCGGGHPVWEYAIQQARVMFLTELSQLKQVSDLNQSAGPDPVVWLREVTARFGTVDPEVTVKLLGAWNMLVNSVFPAWQELRLRVPWLVTDLRHGGAYCASAFWGHLRRAVAEGDEYGVGEALRGVSTLSFDLPLRDRALLREAHQAMLVYARDHGFSP